MSRIETITPILSVDSVAASIHYYVDVLGFTLDWHAGGMAGVMRDGQSLMLCASHQGRKGTWVWIGVEDVDALLAEFAAKGALIRDPPTNFQWAYEMQVEDPDGHVLRFGTEPKDAPFGQFKL